MHLHPSQGSTSPGPNGFRPHLCRSKWLWCVYQSFLDLFRSLLMLNNAAVTPDSDAGEFYTEKLHRLKFALFASCWTVAFALYLILTSATVYTRSDRPIGRFFNHNFVFAVDGLSAVFWFASFISLAHFIQAAGYCSGYNFCGTMTTSTVIAVFLWYDHCLPLTSRKSTDELAVSPSSRQPS